MRILIVDELPRFSDALRHGLRESGFSVDVVNNGMEGRCAAIQKNYHLIVLDRNLPDVDGLSVLRDVRDSKATPIMILSDRDCLEDKIRCFQYGADDYMTKPVALAEFLARVGTYMRRLNQDGSQGAIFRLDDLMLDLSAKRVERGGRRLDLTRKEFSLLLMLMQRSGEIISRATLAEQVWNMEFDATSNVIDVAVKRLRSKVDDPFDVRLLHTVRGLGFVLERR